MTSELFTDQQARALFLRLTYKPGWHLEPVRGPQGPGLRITAVVSDARNRHRRPVPQATTSAGRSGVAPAVATYGGGRAVAPAPGGPTVGLSTTVDVPASLYGLESHVAEELLLQEVHHVILQLEAHEVREWFRLDGRMVDSPHRREPEPGEAYRGILGLLGVFS